MSIRIPPELETRLRAKAQQEGLTIEDYLERLMGADERGEQELTSDWLDRERAQNPGAVLRNYNQDVERSMGDVAKFEGPETVGYDCPYGPALFHQADLKVFQKSLRTSFENLAHSRCTRFCRVNSQVQIKSGCLKDDLPAGR